MLIGTFEDNEGSGIELLAIDQGPELAMSSNACTTAIQARAPPAMALERSSGNRISWTLLPGRAVGTGVLARIKPGRPVRNAIIAYRMGSGLGRHARPGRMRRLLERRGERCDHVFRRGRVGHGQDAAEASVEAVRLFHRFSGHRVPTLLEYVHGACVPLAAPRFLSPGSIPRRGRFIFRCGQCRRRLVFERQFAAHGIHAGTAGHNARKIQGFDYPFENGLIVLCSDGISTSWNFGRYPGIQSRTSGANRSYPLS